MLAIFALFHVILANRVFTYADYLSATATTGCVSIDGASALVVDMATSFCGDPSTAKVKCPGCYVIKQGSYQLTVENCHYMPIVGSVDANHVRIITFANIGPGTPGIHDGTSVVKQLAAVGNAGAMTNCMCVEGRLACS